MRGELPDSYFATADSSIQMECLSPLEYTAASMTVTSDEVLQVETRALDKLRDVRKLLFYPGYRQCTPENMFFCKHA